jgi:uncharacterized membrane protein
LDVNSSLVYQDKSSAAELSDYLRNGRDEALKRRREVVGLSLLSAGMMGAISAMQMGLIKAPKPPTRWIDGSIPNSAPQAYRIGKTPDGLLGLVSYSITAMLAGMGGRNRAQIHPLVPITLAAKATIDAANAAKLLVEQPLKYRAICLLCTTAAIATFLALPKTLHEAGEAFRTLTGARRQRSKVQAVIGRVHTPAGV